MDKGEKLGPFSHPRKEPFSERASEAAKGPCDHEGRAEKRARSSGVIGGMHDFNAGVTGESSLVESENGGEAMHRMAATRRTSCAGFPETRY
jgi:hypothetical protein